MDWRESDLLDIPTLFLIRLAGRLDAEFRSAVFVSLVLQFRILIDGHTSNFTSLHPIRSWHLKMRVNYCV